MAAIVQCHREDWQVAGLLLMLLPLQEQKCQRVSNRFGKTAVIHFHHFEARVVWQLPLPDRVGGAPPEGTNLCAIRNARVRRGVWKAG